MTNLIENKYFKWFLGAVLLVLIIVALHWCNSNPQPINEPITPNYEKQDYHDSIVIVQLMERHYQDSLKIIASRHKEDSINSLKNKYVGLYQKSKATLIEQIKANVCDTNNIKDFIAKSDSTNKIKDDLIAQKDTTIARLETDNKTVLEANTKLQTSSDNKDKVIEGMVKDKIADDKQDKEDIKNSLWKGRLQGGAVGLGVGFIGGLIVK